MVIGYGRRLQDRRPFAALPSEEAGMTSIPDRPAPRRTP